MIRYRAWYDNKMMEVRAIDWDYKGNIISCHLEENPDKVDKVYPMEKYGDDVKLMRCIGVKDSELKYIYEGDIVEYFYDVNDSFGYREYYEECEVITKNGTTYLHDLKKNLDYILDETVDPEFDLIILRHKYERMESNEVH